MKCIIQKIMIICIAMVLLTALGCQKEAATKSKAPEKIKIGIMTMTTGNLAFLGENIVRSTELAIEQLGYKDKVILIVEDVGYLGGGQGAVTAYRKLVDVDKVQFIIDGMTSDGTMAVAPLLDQDKVVMITPLTGGENIDNAAEYLFRNGPSDVLAGVKPAQDLQEKFRFERVALFTDNAEYTLDIAKHFRNTYAGKIVVDEIITPDQTDYRTELLRLENKKVDAIVLNTATGTSAIYIMKQLYELGNTKPIFANFIAWNGNTLSIAGNGAEGIYVYDPQFDETAEQTKDFFARYEQKYGKKPTIPFHTTGTYDALAIGLKAISVVDYDGERIHDWLLNNAKDWKGMNGVVTFDEKGNTKTGFVLKRVVNGTLVLV